METKAINGKVVEVLNNTQVPKKDGGTYPGTLLTFRNLDFGGKIEERGFHENSFKFNGALKASLETLQSGEEFTMLMEKKGDFWNVKSIGPKGSVAIPAPQAEARADRGSFPKIQVYIIRQSSISSAVALMPKASPEDVIATAKKFEAYVLGEELDDGSIFTMPSDLVE